MRRCNKTFEQTYVCKIPEVLELCLLDREDKSETM